MTRILLATLLLAATACQPTWRNLRLPQTTPSATGYALCDDQADIVDTILEHGFTVDCTPDFPAVRGDTGAPIWGWTDVKRSTVWLWPGHWGMGERDVRVALYHELHHVQRPGSSEADAIMYSFCMERPPGGFTLLDATPTDARCEAVGA